MVLLDALNPTLNPNVVMFVDVLVGLHLAALAFYMVVLARDFANTGKRGKVDFKGE